MSQSSSLPRRGRVWISGPAGRLEALIDRPVTDCGTHAALFCHPHPEYGGTMHHKVVYRAARAARDLGVPALRFNFRGVEASAGEFDSGRGEMEDARASLEHLATVYPGRRLLAGGFSFGAWTAALVGEADPRVDALISIGTPIGIYGADYLARVSKPILFVHGSEDRYGAVDELAAIARRTAGPAEFVRIEGAEHLFTDREGEVYAAVRDFLRRFVIDGGMGTRASDHPQTAS
jgi:alpha/beta superfamily hydrolase